MTLPFPAPERSTEIPRTDRADIWEHADTFVGAKSLEVSMAKNVERRMQCERSLALFLHEYMPHVFYEPSETHLDVVELLELAVLCTGIVPMKHALAAPRSFGKTTIGEAAGVWIALYHHRDFLLFIGSRGDKGEGRLATIKNELMTNRAIAEDFPEIVNPIREFNANPRSAPADYPWAIDRVRLANGVWIHGRGIDSSIEGIKELNARPDFVWMDDVETISSVRSTSETEFIETNIRKGVLRLHDINRPAAYFFICTLHARDCIAARFTDPKLEPEWRGRRYKALKVAPARADLWDKFMEYCRGRGKVEAQADIEPTAHAIGIELENFEKLTEGYRVALRFYVANKDTMDAGAELLDSKRLSLHTLYHIRATEGEETFLCELQNDPPEDQNTVDAHLDLDFLLSRRVDTRARIVPNWAAYVLCSIDVGMYRLHWEVDAWAPDLQTSQMIECGIQETNVDAGGKLKMADVKTARQSMVMDGVRFALGVLHQHFSQGWPRESGSQALRPNLIGVDCGGTAEELAWYETILRHCHARGRSWIPLKGERWSESIADRAAGRNWIHETANNPGRRIDCNADEYKLRLVRSYECPEKDSDGKLYRGARLLHYDTPNEYCVQQTAERYVTKFTDTREVNKAQRVGWFPTPGLARRNHWFDTAWMQFALADIAHTIARHAPSTRAPRRQLPQEYKPYHDPAFG